MVRWSVALAWMLAALVCSTVGSEACAADRNVVVVKSQPASELRTALVIGNADYPGAPLGNPVNDARAIADRLESLHFRVTRLENATQEQMYEAIRAFGDSLRAGGVGLFYYAGHALQVRGRNYLLPVRSMIEREDEIPYRTVDTGLVLDKMENARNRVNIVILDACRNNPFGREFRNVSPGLAVVDAPSNTLIAFATAPGAVASDGSGRNGLYTQHLLQAIGEPGLRLEDAFKKVRSGVRRDSAGRQLPWESTSLEVDFFFEPAPATPAEPPAPVAAPAAPAPVATPSPLAIELAFWDSVKGSTDPEDFRAYLRRYPDGSFATLAANRLRALAPAPPVAAAPPAASPQVAVAAPTVTAPVPVPIPVAPAVAPMPVAPPTASLPPPATAEAAATDRSPPSRVLSGGGAGVMAMAVSRNGQLALTAEVDRTLRLWDLGGGRELRRFGGGPAASTAVAFSPDGRQLIAGRTDRSLVVWDLALGAEVAALRGHGAPVAALAFDPTGRYAFSAAEDGEVLLWEVAPGKIVRRAAAGQARARSLALGLDGRQLLTASDDGAVRLWDVGTLAVARSFGPMAAPAVAVAFVAASRSVAAVDARGTLCTWETRDGAVLRCGATEAASPVLAAFAADGSAVVVADAAGALSLWDTVSGRLRWRTSLPGRRITAVALGARGTVALAAGDDRRVLSWTLER